MIDPTAFAVHTASPRGFRQAFVHEGVGGVPLVCVHGWPETKRIFWKVIEPLAAAGFEVVVPDLRGFGIIDLERGLVAGDDRVVCRQRAPGHACGCRGPLGIQFREAILHRVLFIVWQRAICRGHDMMRRPLEHEKVSGFLADRGCRLNTGRARADDRHPLAFQIDRLSRPSPGVIDLAGKFVLARPRRSVRRRERSGGAGGSVQQQQVESGPVAMTR